MEPLTKNEQSNFSILEGIASLIIIASYFLPCYVIRFLHSVIALTPMDIIKDKDEIVWYILFALPILNICVKFFFRSAWLSWLSLAALIAPLQYINDGGGTEAGYGVVLAAFGGIIMVVSLLITGFMDIKRPRMMLRISLFFLIITSTIWSISIGFKLPETAIIATPLLIITLFFTLVALIKIPFCKEESANPTLQNILSTRNLVYAALLPILLLLIFSIKSCFSGTKSNDANDLAYIAVQFERNDNWSIVDGEGEILVNKEYSPKDRISFITPEGTYWVKSGNDSKIRFYSIDSPRKPISPNEYTSATGFFNGYAFACDGKNPIQCIDTDGEVVNTLSKDIQEIALPKKATNRIRYKGKNGLYGYVNEQGEIVIEAQYSDAEHFGDGAALVRKSDNKDYLYIIDEQGKETGKIDLDKYRPTGYSPAYSEGLLAVTDNGYDLLYLNKEGEVALNFKNKNYYITAYSNFAGGYAVVTDEYNRATGVIDKEGEVVVRIGKYSQIINMGNGAFAVADGNWKTGIVDANDNTMLNLEYDNLGAIVGGNYVMQKGNYWYFITPDGKRIEGINAHNIERSNPASIEYNDITKIAKDLVSRIGKKGYTSIIGKTKVKDIANAYKLDAASQNRYVRYLDLPSFKADTYDVTHAVNFSNRILKEKTHEETANDGWFSYKKTVSDGWEWNDEAELENIYIRLTELSYQINIEDLIAEIGKQLEKKGFKLVCDGPYYEAKNGDKYAGVSINGGTREIEITFYPYREFSEEF